MIPEFLTILYAEAGPSEMCRIADPQTVGDLPVRDTESIAQLVAELTAARRHAFFRSCTYVDDRPFRTYFAFLDVDLAGGAHKRDDLPATTAEIDAALVALGVPRPTFVVRTSDGGRHYYWKLSAPIEASEAPCRALQRAVRKGIKPLHLDPTHDVQRLVRMPGSVNFKPGVDQLVVIEEANLGTTVDPAFLISLNPPEAAPPPFSSWEQGETTSGRPCSAAAILAACAPLQAQAGKAGYDLWLAALSAFARCHDGEDVAQAWSRGYPTYSEADTRAKLEEARKLTPPTYARIMELCGVEDDPFLGRIHGLTALGYRDPALVELASQYVYEFPTRRYFPIAGGPPLDHRAFDDAVRFRVSGAHHQLCSWQATPRVSQVTYLPGRPRFPDVHTFNIWRPDGIDPQPGDWSGIDALIPTDGREHVLDVLAFHLQNPGQKIAHAVLLRGIQGSGKTSLADVVRDLVGHANYRAVTGDALSARWTADLADVQALFIDEVRQPNGYDSYNRLKAVLTEDRISVEQKHQTVRLATAPRLVLAASNQIAPLPLEPGDRRFFVPDFARSRIDAGYLRENWAAQVSAFKHALLSRDVSRFSPKAPPPMTRDKLAIIEHTRPGLEAAIADAMVERDGPFAKDLLTTRQVRLWHTEQVTDRAVGIALSAAGAVKLGQLREGDLPEWGRAQVWAWKNVAHWQGRGRRDWAAHLVEGLTPALRIMAA